MEEIDEVNLEEAKKIVNRHKSKFVWLGLKPLINMPEVLGIGTERFETLDPNAAFLIDKWSAERLSNSVFVCPHGNTSLMLVQQFKEDFGVRAYSLKGGISAIVGEGNY